MRGILLRQLMKRTGVQMIPVNPIAYAAQITSFPVSLNVGDTGTAAGRLVDINNVPVSIGYSLYWSSDNSAVVTIDSSTGAFTAAGVGGTNIKLRDAGNTVIVGTVAVIVTTPINPPAAVVVVPSTITIDQGAAADATAFVQDMFGANLRGRTVTWVPTNSAICTADADDASADPTHRTTIHGVAVGSTTVTVTDVGTGDNVLLTVNVTAPAGGSPIPANGIVLTDQPCSAIPPPAGTVTTDAYGWTQYFPNPQNLSIVSGAWRVTFPQGMAGGVGPVKIKYGAFGTPPNYKEIWHHIKLRVATGFSNAATGNAQHTAVVGTKFGFTYCTANLGANESHFYINLFGGGDAPGCGFMGVNIEGPGISKNWPVSNWLWPNHYDELHDIKVQCIANTQGQSNGIIRFYIDDVLIMEVLTAKFFVDTVNPPGWGSAEIAPTFGGAFPNQVVANTMHFDIDNYRIIGLP